DGAAVDEDSTPGIAADDDGVVLGAAENRQEVAARRERRGDRGNDPVLEEFQSRQEATPIGLFAARPRKRPGLFLRQSTRPGQCHEQSPERNQGTAAPPT